MTPLLLSLLLLLVKSLCVFALAGLTLFALRRASAASRHLVCLLTLCALLALPLLWWTPLSLPVSVPIGGPLAPNNGGTREKTLTPRPLLPQGEGVGADAVGAGSHRPSSDLPAFPNPSRFGRGGEERAGVGSAPAPQNWGGGAFLLALWLLGVLAAALRPLLGLWGIGKLGRSSRAETSPAVLTLAAECAAILGLPRVPAIRRGDVPVPITWGLRRPVVLLPDAVDDWPDGRLRAVLLHELAHIRRRDWAAHRLADLACAQYWFHPLVWLTARRLRDESELACDDLVLSCGIPAPDYARHLLDIARALSSAAPPAPTGAIGMARTARVEGRITQMLNPTQNRRAVTRRTVVVFVAAAALGVGTLTALRPAAQAAPQRSAKRPVSKQPMSKATARVSAVHAVPGEFDAMTLVGEGRFLTPQAAAKQENILAAHPNDYAAHILLLGYYNRKQFGLPHAQAAPYEQQVFWFIRTHPESVLCGQPYAWLLKRQNPEGFEQGKALWLEQVAAHPHNTTILGKAADFCNLSDDPTVERLLKQAQALKPKNPEWPRRLGELYALQSQPPGWKEPALSAEQKQALAQAALAEYETASRLAANPPMAGSFSKECAVMAYAAGDYDKAQGYANNLLDVGQKFAGSASKDYFHQGDEATHYGNLVLGRLALHNGDQASAEAHLLAMGRISGSSSLDSFGPNMSLAQDLLAVGQRDSVLTYFDECAKFWKNPKLAAWRSAVQQGKTPDFGANLDY